MQINMLSRSTALILFLYLHFFCLCVNQSNDGKGFHLLITINKTYLKVQINVILNEIGGLQNVHDSTKVYISILLCCMKAKYFCTFPIMMFISLRRVRWYIIFQNFIIMPQFHLRNDRIPSVGTHCYTVPQQTWWTVNTNSPLLSCHPFETRERNLIYCPFCKHKLHWYHFGTLFSWEFLCLLHSINT